MDRNLLARATEGTDAPTPGYLYVDLTKSATANPMACSEMAQYLTRKLASKQNPNIKAKCCKVIAKLAESVPRNQFRRCIAQDSQAVAAIKEAITFRGPMDPVQGDTKNEKVRVAAREALDAVYNEAPSSEIGGSSGMSMQGVSASYASAPHAGGAGYGGSDAGFSGARRMEGIGNPMYSDPRLDARYNGTIPAGFKEAMAEAGEVLVGMIKDPLARNVGVPDVPSRGHSGNLPGYGPTYGRPPPGATELSRQTGGQWTMASNRGPGAYAPGGATPTTSEYHKDRDTGFNSWNNNASGTSATAGVPGGSWGSVASRTREPAYGTPSVTVISNSGGGGGTTGGGATSDGTYERSLILELCPPGGVKPVPPPDKLQQFARNVPNLNADLVCPVLLDFLEEGQPWIIRAKALCVMETAIQNGTSPQDGTNPYKTFFHACHEEIEPLGSHPRAAIQEPARRVLVLLGFTPRPLAAAAAPPAPTTAPPPPAPVAADLFDFSTDDAALSIPGSPPAHLPPPTEAPPPPPPVAAAAGSSMFGGMTIKGAPPAAAPPAAVVQPQPVQMVPPTVTAAAGSLLDFGDSFIPDSSPDVNATATMFGDLSVKEEKKNEADVTPPSTTGSAFSFMNKEAVAAAAPVAPKPAVFDPMSNFGGATVSTTATPAGMSMPTHVSPMAQTKVMALSTEQMQAMAYHQMLMQQQYQMQIAMMQQRGGVGSMPAPPQMQFRQSSGGMNSSGLSMGGFKPQQPHLAGKDDKKFDFVKDAMTASTKKH